MTTLTTPKTDAQHLAERLGALSPLDKLVAYLNVPLTRLLQKLVQVWPTASDYYLGYDKTPTYTRTYDRAWFPFGMSLERAEDGDKTFKLDVAQWCCVIEFKATAAEAKTTREMLAEEAKNRALDEAEELEALTPK